MKIKTAASNLIISVGVFALSHVYLTPIAWAQNTKNAQCDRIIDIANEAVTAAQSANSDEGEDQLQALLTAAESIDEAANKMANLSLSDGALNGYRQGFITMYRQTSLMTRRFVDAFATEDQEQIFAALNDLQTATQDEDRLVTDLNNYCDRQSN
jgi:hypothetical protein